MRPHALTLGWVMLWYFRYISTTELGDVMQESPVILAFWDQDSTVKLQWTILWWLWRHLMVPQGPQTVRSRCHCALLYHWASPWSLWAYHPLLETISRPLLALRLMIMYERAKKHVKRLVSTGHQRIFEEWVKFGPRRSFKVWVLKELEDSVYSKDRVSLAGDEENRQRHENVGHDSKDHRQTTGAPADGMEGTREKQNRNSEWGL